MTPRDRSCGRAARPVLTSAVMLIAALGIRLASPGPIVYRTVRAGLLGAPFTMYKLRTMHVGSHDGGRITSAGCRASSVSAGCLRRTKLDEVPQLVNVLKGDMALVGPRPEDLSIVQDHYDEWMWESLSVRPGMTSPGSLRYFAEEPSFRTTRSPRPSTSNTCFPASSPWTWSTSAIAACATRSPSSCARRWASWGSHGPRSARRVGSSQRPSASCVSRTSAEANRRPHRSRPLGDQDHARRLWGGDRRGRGPLRRGIRVALWSRVSPRRRVPARPRQPSGRASGHAVPGPLPASGVVIEKTVGNTLRVPYVPPPPRCTLRAPRPRRRRRHRSARRQWQAPTDWAYLRAKMRHFPLRLVPSYGAKFLANAPGGDAGRRGPPYVGSQVSGDRR